jgi:hypothetical protein
MLYDAMLTNERLILMDNMSALPEPRMIPFMAIVTVKGGTASTGEPAIILTLDDASGLNESGQAILIFTHQPGEKRKHERELWVKKLIELVIAAREQEAQKEVAPVKKKTGMQPSVRRWEAPESPRPDSSVIDQGRRIPEPIVVTEVDPDPLEFFFEERSAKKAESQNEEPPEEHTAPHEGRRSYPDEVKAAEHQNGHRLPVEFPVIRPPQPEGPSPASVPPAPAVQEPAGSAQSAEVFACTILAATHSLQERAEYETLPVKNKVVTKTTPLPDQGKESIVSPARTTPGEKRELPGTYTPEIPAAVVPVSPLEDKTGAPVSKRKPDAPRSHGDGPGVPAILLVIIAVILLLGGIVFAVNYLTGSPYTGTVVTTTPSVMTPQETVSGPAGEKLAGVHVNIAYIGVFTGTVGSPGYMRQVSGTGNQTFSVLMTTSIVQATIQKQDNSGQAMTVEIFDNSTLLARQTITAPMGEISLLIDTKTTRPPGMTIAASPENTRALLGNGSLVYY